MSDWLMPSGDVKFYEFPATKAAADELIVYMPGVLSYGTESLLPVSGSSTDPQGVLGALRAHGDVLTATYTGRNFDPQQIVRRTAETIGLKSFAGTYRRVTIIGSSMGGLLAIDALAQVRLGTRLSVRLVLVDSPFGAADLKGGGNIAAPILSRLNLGRFSRFHRMAVKGVPPKKHEIQGDLNSWEVEATAIRRMKGFSVGVLMQQLAYMGAWRLPAAALPYMGDVHYVRCILGNITISDRAADRWADALYRMHLHEVQSPHCGYLQQPAAFIRTFEEILGA